MQKKTFFTYLLYIHFRDKIKKKLIIFYPICFLYIYRTCDPLYQTIIYDLDIENNGKKLYNRECVMSLQHNARDGTLSMIYDRRG